MLWVNAKTITTQMLEKMLNLIIYGSEEVNPELIRLGYVNKRNQPTPYGMKYVKKQLDGYCCVPRCYNRTVWSCFCRMHGDKYFKSGARGSRLIYDMREIPSRLLGIVEFVCRNGNERGVHLSVLNMQRLDEAVDAELLKVNGDFAQITPKAFGLLS